MAVSSGGRSGKSGAAGTVPFDYHVVAAGWNSRPQTAAVRRKACVHACARARVCAFTRMAVMW